MKTLSRWANCHTRLAILLLITGEIGNAFVGLLLGSNGLADWPGQWLLWLTLTLLGAIVGLRFWRASGLDNGLYATQRTVLFGAFMGNLLLFVMLGAWWGQASRQPAPNRSVVGYRVVSVQADSTVKPTHDGLRTATATSPGADRISTTKDGQNGKRIGYVALLLLGIALAYFSAGLACNIACSGYGFLAAVTLALGLGFMVGGIFFLGRATEKPLKPMRELTQPERRRAVRRFWLSWLVLIGITGLLLLAGTVN